MVSLPIAPQLTLEALAGARMELPVDTPVADLEVLQKPIYQVERILKWWKPQEAIGERKRYW